MADHVSPGVYTREIDLSLYVPILSSSIVGVVGLASRGPINKPTFCGNWTQYTQIFGDCHPNYLMSYFAREFFEWWSQLWVTRVCEHDTHGRFKATSGYVNVFSNTEFPVVNEIAGSVVSGNKGPYTGTLNRVPVVRKSVTIKDNPSVTPVVNESSGQTTEVGVTTYGFITNRTPLIPGSVVVTDTGSTPFETFTDDGNGNLVGDKTPAGSGTVNYYTGEVIITYGTAPSSSAPTIVLSYAYYSAQTETFTDDGQGTLIGSAGGVGTIDYKTGEYKLTFRTAPTISGPLSVNYRYRTPSDGVLQLIALWPGEGGNDLSVLVTDGSPYLDEIGRQVLPVSMGGTSFRIVVYDRSYKTNIEFDCLSMYPGQRNIYGESRYVEHVIGNKRFGEYGWEDSKTNDYICAKVMKNPVLVTMEETSANTDAGVQTYSFTLKHQNIVPGTVHIYSVGDLLEEFFDDADNPGVLKGTAVPAGEGAINYMTGVVTITYGSLPTQSIQILVDYEYASVENPYVGTNGYMYYIDPDRFGVVPEYDYVRAKGDDAIEHLKDSDVVGTFDRATNTRTGIYSFYDPEMIDINLLAAPGFSSAAVASALITVSEYRKDSMSLVDPPLGLSVQEVVDWHNGDLRAGVPSDETPGDLVGFTTAALNSSYAAMYYPWGKLYDSRNSTYVWVPPSVGAIRAIAKNDQVADVGKAPAGYNRGDLPSWIDIEYSPNQGERDYMYGNNNAVNPIVKVPKLGITILGERTLYRQPTKLDRIHVRRMLLYMKKVIATAARFLLFEPHDWETWYRFKLLVEPYLRFEKQRRNLYRYEIVCDETTNTPYMIDTNTMVGNIYIWPESVVERLMINFIITPMSISFEEAYQIVQGRSSEGSAYMNFVRRTGATP